MLCMDDSDDCMIPRDHPSNLGPVVVLGCSALPIGEVDRDWLACRQIVQRPAKQALATPKHSQIVPQSDRRVQRWCLLLDAWHHRSVHTTSRA